MCSLAAHAADLPLPVKPEYNRDVRPILADACFRCHGFDKNKREAERRLDTRDGAMLENDGTIALVPGKPEESALISRIFSSDGDEIMPPPKEARQLTSREKEILKLWVKQGGEYQDHWAFIPPVKPAVPETKPGETKNSIDAFVLSRLAQIGINPSPEADRVALVRRLHFDLTGLPPSSVEVESFLNDASPNALAARIDKLIASPQFGERMAVWWLDQVRFADTIGYHSDNPMPVSPFRDYVIRCFNENKPFNRFTTEQVAGDLLPDKSQETLIASAYNRLTLSTEEGGAQAKQYEAKYLVDRVKSIGTTWLGQTYMCAECHDHKYDPVTSKDFYALGAFFADVEEVAVGKRGAGIPVFSPQQQAEFDALGTQMDTAEKRLKEPRAELDAAQKAWESETLANLNFVWGAVKFSKLEAPEGTVLEQQKDDAIFAKSAKQGEGTYVLTTNQLRGNVVGIRLEALPHDKLPAKGPGRAGNGNFVISEFIGKIKRANGSEETMKFNSATATHEQSSHGEGTPYNGWRAAAVIDGDVKGKEWGWAILPETGKANTLTLGLEKPVVLAEGDVVTFELLQNHGSGTHGLGHFRIRTTSQVEALKSAVTAPLPVAMSDILKLPEDKRNDAQKAQLRDHFRNTAPLLEAERKALAALKQKRTEIEAAVDRCLVTVSNKNLRTVRILPRGDWQNESGEVVLPATPKYLPAGIESTPENRRNRLDLANWLTNPKNPLTARVQVNRLWKLFYGNGIVKTLEDMGTQSELPEHLALLDWLACEFMDSGWDIKHMVKLMVSSRTYAQSSRATPESLARDPQNRELARGGRWRLDAEFVRDNALAISGLLVQKVGGRSVNPYQPAGYWENLNFPTREWPNSKDENQWRRGLYTWWQRSYLHPAMVAFDAPTREECAPDRVRSNIPQQALVLLNDMTFVEAARVFAANILQQAGTDDERIKWAWKQATCRTPDETEFKVLRSLLEKHRAEFSQDAKAAAEIVKVGYKPAPSGPSVPELAAWTSVARTILNLHETITRP